MEHFSPAWDERFLSLAHHVSGWSKDPSTKVGAVIVRRLARGTELETEMKALRLRYVFVMDQLEQLTPAQRVGYPNATLRKDMIEAGELDDAASPRLARFLPQFRFVDPPDPERGDWSAWEALLADRTARSGDARDAMCIVGEGEYGTVSSAEIALPRHITQAPVFRHAEGRPGEAAFADVGE